MPMIRSLNDYHYKLHSNCSLIRLNPKRLRLRLKPEQRILALTIVKIRGKHRFLLGIVYRGNRWLDGAIFEPLGRRRTLGVAEIVRKSQYFKELRYIMFRGRNASQIDGRRLNLELKLPVIGFGLVRGKRSRLEAWGVEKEVAETILDAFTSIDSEPDAVSVANLLKRALEHPI